jgi:steroid delta-isomerase-like uncharacterized protein
MSQDNRVRAIRWMEENWNERRAEVANELMHPECCGRMEGLEVRSRQDWLQARRELLAAFPDIHMKVEQTVAEGDTVVVRWRANGTHRGDALGVPASGRAFEAVGTTWMRFVDGRMVWGYDTWNQGALLASLAAS